MVGFLLVVALQTYGVASQVFLDTPVPVVVVLATAFVVACMTQVNGMRGSAAFLVLVIAIPFASEFLGVLTGIPYGPYRYRAALGPWAFGLVPFFILVAWVFIGYMVIVTSTLALGRTSYWLAPVDGALAMAWDLMVDPAAVRAGYWTWSPAGPFYGVPASNFLGWFAVVMLFSLAVRWVWSRDANAPAVPSRTVLMLIPSSLALSSVAFAIGDASEGMWAASIAGLGVLLPALALALRRFRAPSPALRVPRLWGRPEVRTQAAEAPAREA